MGKGTTSCKYLHHPSTCFESHHRCDIVNVKAMVKAELGKPLVLGELEPDSSDSAAILWLHGFGDSPGGWAAGLQPFRTSVDAKWKWIHLCAPTFIQPCFGNRKFRAWGQFFTQERLRPGSTDYTDNDKEGAYASSVEAVLAELVELERSLPPNRLVIGGFSQGAAIALECALRYPKALAGCIVLAGWARPPVHELLAAAKGKQEISTPFLLCHGECDDMVDVSCAEAAKDMLLESGANVQFHKYPGIQHESCPELLTAVMEFMCRNLHLQIPGNVKWENGSDSDSENALVYVSRSRLEPLQNAQGDLSNESIVELLDPAGLAETETLVPAVLQPEQLLSMPPAEAIKVIAEAVGNSTGPEITVKEWRDMHCLCSEQAEEEELSNDDTDDDSDAEPQEDGQSGQAAASEACSEPPEKRSRREGD
eukprot:s298_g16.t1